MIRSGRQRRGESLKAYLCNVQGQLHSDECWSHHCLLFNPFLSALTFISETDIKAIKKLL